MTKDIRVGAVGWDHAGWRGAYYPDDLPSDWGLSYYANEFSILLVPSSVWSTVDCDQYTHWRDDVPEAFRFILDITSCLDGPDCFERLRMCAEALGEKLAGLISWSPLPSDLQTRLDVQVGSGLLMTITPAQQSQRPGVIQASNAQWHCMVMTEEAGRDLALLRTVMEPWVSHEPPGIEVALLFSGDPPEIKVMKDAEILQQLLGGMGR